jgi:uracil-DNA glycosylase
MQGVFYYMISRPTLPNEWLQLISHIQPEGLLNDIMNRVEQEYNTYRCFPEIDKIFKAFEMVSPSKVKVVIIGQDPYHGIGQANGLAFSVSPGVKIPPSLGNIFKEINKEFGYLIPTNGDLSKWASQGVLLINTTLTVREATPNSHENIGWSKLTDTIVESLANEFKNLVFLCWGAHAIKKTSLIEDKDHLILQSPHPSPLSAHRGFLGNNHFRLANEYLQIKDKSPIDWDLSNQLNFPFD